MNRMLTVLLPLFAITACSGKVATTAGQECGEILRQAENEYEQVNTESLSGGFELMKASNLIAQATIAKQFEKFESCVDKARRARIYIGEARKK